MKIFTYLLSVIMLLFGGQQEASSMEIENELIDVTSMVRIEKNHYFLATESNGFIDFNSKSALMETKNEGLPTKVIYPFNENQKYYQKITSLSVINTQQVAALFSLALRLTNDGGLTWHSIPTAASNGIKSSNYLTSVAITPTQSKQILLGTSFNGLFETVDGGHTWNSLNKKIPGFSKIFYQGADFYDEISALCYGTNPQQFYVAKGYGGGLYFADRTTSTFTEIQTPFKEEILNLRLQHDDPAVLEVYTEENIRFYHTLEKRWIEKIDKLPRFPQYKDKNREERMAKSANKTGLYINGNWASGKRFQSHLEVIKNKNLNSFVIDAKNDQGLVIYDTQLELPKTLKAYVPRYKMADVLKAAKERNLYVIARIVVFKDPKLYRFDNNRLAIWDQRHNSPWGLKIKEVNKETGETKWVQREFWVDPYSEEVWDYNIALAQELQSLGVDEVQFDYIRFPTDGPVQHCYYRHKKSGMRNIDALESFLRKARESLTIPISTDLYGYNCYYKMGNWMGQGIEMFSHYVDVISPMYYPSHFPRSFEYNENYLRWSYILYHEGTKRARSSVKDRVHIRSYIQAFRLPQEFWMEENQYNQYVVEQVRGVKDAEGSGYTLWNNSNQYYMLDALKPEK